MQIDSKTFLAELKFNFATLFARTMTEVIIGADLMDDRVFYFTNLKPVEVEFYSPDPSQFIHRVTFKDNEFIQAFYTQFPVLHQVIAWLRMDLFMTGVNQHAKGLDELELKRVGDRLILYYVVELPHPKNTSPVYAAKQIECGCLLSMYQLDRYNDVYSIGYIEPTTAIRQDLVNRIGTKEQTTILDLGQPFSDDPRGLKCLIHHNKSTVSVAEVINKIKLTGYTHEILLQKQRSVVKINIHFSMEKVDVVSTQPFLLWYFTPTQKIEEPTHE